MKPVPISDQFMVPYDENVKFTGRRLLLRTVQKMLSDIVPKQWNHRVALHGMGGVGKTQIAIAYVYENRAKYERIYWISAANEASLLSGFQAIATRTQCATSAPDSDPKKVARSVLEWLRHQENWLIVIDNLDHVGLVKGYLPDRAPNKHTLITTRNPNAEGIPAEGLEVPVFHLDESMEMLYTLSNMNSSFQSEAAEQVAMELGCLPLALEQAASYIRTVTRSFSAFLDDYQKRRKELHKWIPDGNRQYSHSVANTWSLSFEFLEKDQPETAKLLQFLALLNPDVILLDFIISGKNVLDNTLRELVSDSLKFAKALLSLENFSLIKWSRERKTLSIHRLVQAVVTDQMEENRLMLCMSAIVEMCDVVFPKEVTSETRSLCRLYQDQVVGPILRASQLRRKRTAEVALRVGIFMRDDGKYDDSEQLCLQAVEIYVELVGKEDPDSIRAQTNLAITNSKQGRWKTAAELLETTIKICTKILGEDHPETMTAMEALGDTYWDQGRLAEAAELQEKTLLVITKVRGEHHVETLQAMADLGLTYFHQGRRAEAVELLEKALKGQEKVFGGDHPDTLLTMDNLGVIYRDMGRWAEAAELQEETLAVERRVLGEDHPDTLVTMDNLGVTYRDLGRWAEAADLQEKALAAEKRIIGEDHPGTFAAMNNLAKTYSDQGRRAEAVKLLEDTLTAQRRALGEDHKTTLWTMENLGVSYRDLGRLKEAMKLQEDTLALEMRVLGADHPDTLTTMNSLAKTYGDLGRLAEAVELQEEALTRQMRVLGEDHKATLWTKTCLGVTYICQGRLNEAVGLLEKTLATSSRILGEEHPDTLVTAYHLAEGYRHQTQWKAAAELQEKVASVMRVRLGEQHPSTLKAVESLRILHESAKAQSETKDRSDDDGGIERGCL